MIKQIVKLLLFSVILFVPICALAQDSSSIMVSAFADAELKKIDVTFTKFESAPKDPEYLPGEDIKIVSYSNDGSVFEEKFFNFASFKSPFPCKKNIRKAEVCKPIAKQLIVFMKLNLSISKIKFLYKGKEISSVSVPRGLLKFEAN